MNQPFPPYIQQPQGYIPHAPHGAPPPQPRPGGVELKVSYAVTIVLLVLAGAFFLAIAGVQLYVSETAPSLPLATAEFAETCADELRGIHTACKGTGGRKITWSTTDAAKYRFELDAQEPHALSVDKSGKKLKTVAGTAGTTTLYVDLDPGDYTIRVDDPVGAAAAKGYTLRVDWIAKKGQPPDLSTGRPPGAEFWVALVVALVCFAAVVIPVLLKRTVPLRLAPSGLTTRGGRTYPWNEFLGVRFVNLRIAGQIRPSSAELSFRSGRVEILFRRVKNMYEVKPILEALGQGRNPWA
jgi:hypothetical protein